MVGIIRVLARWGIVLGTTFALLTPWGGAEAVAQAVTGKPPTLVFVTKSDECECVLSLCVAGEQEVLNFLDGNPWGFQREDVDLAETPKAARELKVLAVPVVFLRDAEGRDVARFDVFFLEKDLYAAWQAHQNGGKKP
jgi:hypothetical protein